MKPFSNPDNYITDENLALNIANYLLDKANSVGDFGCGNGYYVNYLRNFGFSAFGYDINPDLDLYNCKHCYRTDLSKRVVVLGAFDWIISLEVGEHIEKQFEWMFMDNIYRSVKHGVIISWAVPGQTGFGHVNEQPNSYIIREFRRKGYKYLQKDSKKLREAATLPWFKKTIMVFKKK